MASFSAQLQQMLLRQSLYPLTPLSPSGIWLCDLNKPRPSQQFHWALRNTTCPQKFPFPWWKIFLKHMKAFLPQNKKLQGLPSSSWYCPFPPPPGIMGISKKGTSEFFRCWAPGLKPYHYHNAPLWTSHLNFLGISPLIWNIKGLNDLLFKEPSSKLPQNRCKCRWLENAAFLLRNCSANMASLQSCYLQTSSEIALYFWVLTLNTDTVEKYANICKYASPEKFWKETKQNVHCVMSGFRNSHSEWFFSLYFSKLPRFFPLSKQFYNNNNKLSTSILKKKKIKRPPYVRWESYFMTYDCAYSGIPVTISWNHRNARNLFLVLSNENCKNTCCSLLRRWL